MLPSLRPETSSTSAFPQVNSGSGQRPSGSMNHYSTRQQSKHAQLEKDESQQQRAARLQRENAAKGRPQPGKKGPTVFRWDPVDGFQIRRRLTHCEVENLWDEFSARKLIFDGFKNCWDYCSEFEDDIADGAMTLDSDSDSDSNDELCRIRIKPTNHTLSGPSFQPRPDELSKSSPALAISSSLPPHVASITNTEVSDSVIRDSPDLSSSAQSSAPVESQIIVTPRPASPLHMCLILSLCPTNASYPLKLSLLAGTNLSFFVQYTFTPRAQ
ncbi:hypothetical protein CPB83DRAFT_949049 [Crepidotus variabilis]|uniref:Uncharacterized protein n=1 Tax=Crepidotus variabilis TaxID=179855 RepID=A0A9P6E787_9AGAR|nr:hypothetical protein CPB83DRAFT_949049 [Crepidotus variabilis]